MGQGYGDRVGALFCAVMSFLAAPLWYAVFLQANTFEASMGFLLVEYPVAESWFGPAVATLQASVPAERRGAAQGAFSALTAFGNVLPAVLGFVAPDELVGYFQGSVALCYVLSSLCFAGAANSLRT